MADLDHDDGATIEHTPIPEQIRDEQGRFAPKEQAQPEPEQQPQPQGDGQEGADGEQPERQGMVPHQALHAAREEAKAIKERYSSVESRLNELQQQNMQLVQMLQMGRQPMQQREPQPAPDWYQDPDAAFQHHIGQVAAPLQQAIQSQREQFSQMMAADKFGVETVQAAQAELEQYARQNPQAARFDWQRIMASPHPYGELVSWHKQRSALSRVGDDPDAFIQAEVDRRLAEMGHQPAPQSQAANPQAARNPQTLPSSFAAARNGGPRSTPQATGARSLSEIMGR